ncbi:MAG: hypothetical protein GX288_08430 [Clostridiales bacterium]|nr:hypothetical protein [Clostridiales bacterium]
MRAKFLILLTSILLSLILMTACSVKEEDTMEKSSNKHNDSTSNYSQEDHTQMLTESLLFVKKELPKRHKNMFTKITKEEFNDAIEKLIENIENLNDTQVYTELNKIIASIGDAHTNINYWDGYSYPLKFWIFEDEVYIINADTSLEEMMYSQVLKIDGVDIDEVVKQLTSLISYENESWLLARLPRYLQWPVFMYGLGIIENEQEAVFTVLKDDGTVQDFTVTPLEFDQEANYVDQIKNNPIIGEFEKNYYYDLIPDSKAIYFQYNVCANMDDLIFKDFNKEMFNTIEENAVDKIVVDLRSNTGGNSEILNPFTKSLKSYIKKNSDVKVYTLVGRNTFSSGMFAIYRIKEAVPQAISVGEPTGGALDCFGEVKIMELPNTQIPISYSTKYFEFTKSFKYKNDGVGTFLPDITIRPTIEDFKSGRDVVLNYVLEAN